MYTDYFGFNENPFSIAPNPRYLYMSKMHQEALAHLVYGTTSKGCIVLLTGEVGTGKTTLSRYFLEKLPKTTDIAIITNPKLTSNELLATICDEFEIKLDTKTPSTKNYIDSINAFLLKGYSSNRQTVLIIDEAQNLDSDVLEMLRLLTNLETDQQKLLKIVLLGQSELASVLNQPDQEQINQRITSRYHLRGLDRDDVEAYIAHRIMVAGGGRSAFFTKGAISQVFSTSRGIPRLINNLCNHALLGAYSENKEQVDKKIVQQAAAESLGEKTGHHPRSRTKLILVLTASAVLIVCTLLFGPNIIKQFYPGQADPQIQQQTTLEKTSQPEIKKSVADELPAAKINVDTKIVPDLEILPPGYETSEQPIPAQQHKPDPLYDDYPATLETNGAEQSEEETNITINPIEVSE